MEITVYESMAKSFAAQLKDILSGATYDQSDAFLDLVDQLLLDPLDEEPVKKLEELVLAIYSVRVDDVAGDVSLDEIFLKEPEKKTLDDTMDEKDTGISMDDFLFRI